MFDITPPTPTRIDRIVLDAGRTAECASFHHDHVVFDLWLAEAERKVRIPTPRPFRALSDQAAAEAFSVFLATA